MILGWDVCLVGMRFSKRARLAIPPKLGYGTRGAGGWRAVTRAAGGAIPLNATLILEVDVLEVRGRARGNGGRPMQKAVRDLLAGYSPAVRALALAGRRLVLNVIPDAREMADLVCVIMPLRKGREPGDSRRRDGARPGRPVVGHRHDQPA